MEIAVSFQLPANPLAYNAGYSFPLASIVLYVPIDIYSVAAAVVNQYQ